MYRQFLKVEMQIGQKTYGEVLHFINPQNKEAFEKIDVFYHSIVVVLQICNAH